MPLIPGALSSPGAPLIPFTSMNITGVIATPTSEGDIVRCMEKAANAAGLGSRVRIEHFSPDTAEVSWAFQMPGVFTVHLFTIGVEWFQAGEASLQILVFAELAKACIRYGLAPVEILGKSFSETPQNVEIDTLANARIVPVALSTVPKSYYYGKK